MDYKRAVTYLTQRGQAHLLDYFDELSPSEQKQLLCDVENANFAVVKNIKKAQNHKTGKLTPIPAVTVEEINARRSVFEDVGLKLLEDCKVGAVLLAGGQGTRLGSDKPKGMFNIGVTRTLTIFEQQMNNIKQVVARTGRFFPLFIMTSYINDAATRAYFEENGYFGFPKDRVHFFIQNVAPTCDFDGKVFLDEKYRISFSPNGNGGWYSSLINSGLNSVLERENIEWLNVYSVDNVLQRICDPAFIGATVLKRCSCGAKVVKKVSAEEKVGVLCREDGKPAIIEYYEMPEKLANKRKKGELVFCYGVTLNYLFSVQALNSTLSGKLPYHLAVKAIPHVEGGERITPVTPCGYKFETLIVDMVKMMDSCLAFEVEREREFAPVKNSTGVDSVDTARALLALNGVTL